MVFFDKAQKAFDDLGREATKRVSPAAAKAWKQVDSIGREAGRRVAPAAKKALKRADTFARGARNYISPDPARNALSQDAGGASDWKFVDMFGDAIAKHVGVDTDEVWKSLLSGNVLNGLSEYSGSTHRFTEEQLSGFGDKLKKWIMEHPKEVGVLLACIAAAPVTVAVVPAVLGLVGFTPFGVAAGSLAASLQAGLGPIASGSAFAILMSAGAGGYGLIVIQTIAASSTVVPVCSAAAVGFLEAMKEETCDQEERESSGN